LQHSQQATCTHIYVIFVLLNSIWLKQMIKIQGLFTQNIITRWVTEKWQCTLAQQCTLAHQLSPHAITHPLIFLSKTSRLWCSSRQSLLAAVSQPAAKIQTFRLLCPLPHTLSHQPMPSHHR
jgi:hypothetical protein